MEVDSERQMTAVTETEESDQPDSEQAESQVQEQSEQPESQVQIQIEQLEGQVPVQIEQPESETPVQSTQQPESQVQAVDQADRLLKLPLSRVKTIIKMDPDVTLASQEAVVALTKAAVRVVQDCTVLAIYCLKLKDFQFHYIELSPPVFLF